MPLPCGTCRADAPEALLEALLFLSGGPMKLEDICRHTGWSREEAENAAAALDKSLSAGRGIMLLRVAGGYQLVTRPELYEAVRWVRTGPTELSPMALEVLAIVAFKQPVTRADIEKLRGVSSERILSALLQQGLIVDLGRKDTPGRPIVYGTSEYFLECIGMDSLEELAGRVPSAWSAAAEEAGKRNEEKTTTTQEEADGAITESNE